MSVMSMQSLATHVCQHRIELAIRTLYANAGGTVQTTAALPAIELEATATVITATWPLELFLNSRLRKFRHGISIVERVINLARERWTLTA